MTLFLNIGLIFNLLYGLMIFKRFSSFVSSIVIILAYSLIFYPECEFFYSC